MSRVWGYLNSFEPPIWIDPLDSDYMHVCLQLGRDRAEQSHAFNCAGPGETFHRKLKLGVRREQFRLSKWGNLLSPLQRLITVK